MTNVMKTIRNLKFKYLRFFLLCMLLPIFGCLPVVAEEMPLNTIVNRMTSEAVFKLKPKETPAYFKDLCTLDSKGAGKYLWVYENKKPGKDMLWLRVEFQPGIEGQSSWSYLQSQMAFPLKSSTFPDIYGELKKRLSEKLGKPEVENNEQEGKSVEWSVGEYRRVLLHIGYFDNPYLKRDENMVLLESVIMQGEGEN